MQHVKVSANGAPSGIESALRRVARRAEARFGLTSGAGCTVMVTGDPIFMASNAFTTSLDAVQYGLNEGPCVTAVATHHVVRSGSIGAGEARWPRFTAQSAVIGLGSVLSLPVVSEGEAIGSLNLYARSRGVFGDRDVVSITRSAGSLLDDLRSLRVQALAEAATAALAVAVDERADVDVAVGLLMDRYLLSPRSAQVLLHQLARQDAVTEAVAARRLIDTGAAA